ncbi:hypothetical protein [Micromonospora chalcea]|uniref:hypothetical protein n=1 Tax=Micromonospora chalcea TaxID=1874 RepID=UPI0021A46F5C|nr:hypothetical protein [Micromonospora chalcea]MCT2279315.1 hypothetical protein [Micromonospora chalcea]
MVHVPSLARRERLLLAELSGVAARFGIGSHREHPREAAVRAVREVTTDPVLLGIQAGVAMADPQGISEPVVELLASAGADMQVAAEHAAEVRIRLERAGARNSQS